MTERILVLGGYGVFGSRLCARLAGESELEVVVAGRSMARARASCAQFGGLPYVLDIQDSAALARALGTLKPVILIDAAGPYQAYGEDRYRIARQAITAGVHYLDLADDRSFVVGFEALDALAREHGVCALSGVSSVPALSCAVVEVLSADLALCHSIDTAILPGNRAPRGPSLVRTILSQVGQSFRLWEAGGWRNEIVWAKPRALLLRVPGVSSLGPRWASPFNAPDCALFPERYRSLTVRFHAGVELRFLHASLWGASWLVRLG
ncbi:MAG: saccharopine dehydrogenase family protein, partial [Gammaproteobacteria bacterium]